MKSKKSVRPIEILLVEDNPADVRLTQEILKENKIHIHLSAVSNGVEALSFLHRKGKYKNAPRPDLVMLDLNLPGKNGREALAEIKADENLKHIPVVVFTISEAEDDILKSYNLHANCYITKPVNLDQFIKIVKLIREFWFTIVKLPPKERKL